MNKIFGALLVVASTQLSAAGITEFKIPYGAKLNNAEIDGNVTVNLNAANASSVVIKKDFYGADTHGFSKLPQSGLVTPLELGFVKLGGNLHSVYNWELDAYYDSHDQGIFYVYSSLERRLRLIQNNYKSEPMFQVNMLGWQPEKNENGELVMMNTANAAHAAKAISFINGTKKIGLKNILMGNEPFHSLEVHGKPIPSADEYIAKYIEYVLALRSAQEEVSGNPNDIKIWGPEIATGWTGWQTMHPADCQEDYTLPEKFKCSYGNGRFTEFMPYFLYKISSFENDKKLNPRGYKLIDYISFHYYPLFRKDFSNPSNIITDANGNQNVKGMLESVNLWDSATYVNKFDYASPRGVAPRIVKKFQNWRNLYYPTAKLAVTEYGIDSVEEVSFHPIVRPLYLGDLMGRIAQAGINTFVNSFLQSGDTTNSWALIDQASEADKKTRLYNVYSLFSNHFLGTVVPSNDSYGDSVNVYTVKNKMGVTVVLVNKDTKEHGSSVELNGNNDNDKVEVANVKLPAWSVTVLKVPNTSDSNISVYQYGAKEMGIEVDLQNAFLRNR